MANSIVNMPTTKILVDTYNLDVTKLKFDVTTESANGNLKVTKYNYEDAAFDLKRPVTFEVAVSRRVRQDKTKYTSVSLTLSAQWAIVDALDAIIGYEPVVSIQVIQWEGHDAPPDVLALMRFASAGAFLLHGNVAASAVPTLGPLTVLANGRANVYGS